MDKQRRARGLKSRNPNLTDFLIKFLLLFICWIITSIICRETNFTPMKNACALHNSRKFHAKQQWPYWKLFLQTDSSDKPHYVFIFVTWHGTVPLKIPQRTTSLEQFPPGQYSTQRIPPCNSPPPDDSFKKSVRVKERAGGFVRGIVRMGWGKCPQTFPFSQGIALKDLTLIPPLDFT